MEEWSGAVRTEHVVFLQTFFSLFFAMTIGTDYQWWICIVLYCSRYIMCIWILSDLCALSRVLDLPQIVFFYQCSAFLKFHCAAAIPPVGEWGLVSLCPPLPSFCLVVISKISKSVSLFHLWLNMLCVIIRVISGCFIWFVSSNIYSLLWDRSFICLLFGDQISFGPTIMVNRSLFLYKRY